MVNVSYGLVDCHQFCSVVGPGGSLAPWVDGVAHSGHGYVDCSSYFTRGAVFSLNQAAICVNLETYRRGGWVVAWVNDREGRRWGGAGGGWIATVLW